MSTDKRLPDLTLADCLQHYPDLAETLRQMGAKRERARIQAVEAQGLHGFEALIQQFKYDGMTTGSEATTRILLAEKKIQKAMGQLPIEEISV